MAGEKYWKILRVAEGHEWPVLKSGCLDYLTIWPTQNRCPKFGYSNSEKKTLFLEHFFIIFTFLHGSAYTSSKNYIFYFIFVLFLLWKKLPKMKKKYCWGK